MRKLVLALMITLAALVPAFAQDALVLSEGDAGSVRLYTPSGEPADPLSMIDSDGYVIQSTDSSAVFTSPFGDILISPGTLLAVTGFNYDAPSVYLLDGQMTVNLSGLVGLTVYTTSASYSLSGQGQYIFVYTSNMDVAINNSSSDVALYDALRRQESTISAYHYSDLITRQLDMPISAPEEEAEAPAETPVETPAEVPAETPAEETVAEVPAVPEHITLTGSWSFRGYELQYEASTNGSGFVTYPAGLITNADIDAFMASYAASRNLTSLGDVKYENIQDGWLVFSYPAGYGEEDIAYVIDDFLGYLGDYLAAIFVPAAPQFTSVDTTVRPDVAPAPQLLEPVVTTAVPQAPQLSEPTVTPAAGAVPEPPFLVEPWVTVTP